MSKDSNLTTKDKTVKGKGCTNDNHQRLSAGVEDKEMDNLRKWFSDKLALGLGNKDLMEKPKVLRTLDLDGIVDYIKSGNVQNIITMAGAGISTSAGIPDFRSPTSGLYSKLCGFDLPYPEAIFEIEYFRKHPEPFFAMAKELYPKTFEPTPCHYFLRLLNKKGLLLRHYTQNVDALERVAGIPAEKLVEAHGTLHTSRCINPECRKEYDRKWMTEKILSDVVPRCEQCKAVVKPDAVFFGEPLPERFRLVEEDFPNCDLLIILGTSLVVQPFASLVDRVPPRCPRLLINFEEAGNEDPVMVVLGFSCGLQFHGADNFRDVAWLGDCDEGCFLFAEKLGWKDELNSLIENGCESEDSVETGATEST
ncbi:NAD-dependent protein deacetylase sirtuin-2-like isoform X2 [Daphnia pulex]|uniref:NAD-dependent protein deacetylase sirtuin-2-like isoform X2 n=1 Tax=Daphnia pulex TaxID=6669 RepID=UPI001EE0880E|nr:NAD-dependent protein deacetylase sirtuin-2-like isoform X2 [Daphnia pulex]